MDRSAHITYRKRNGVFEITIRRGVTSAELRQLLSKLNMHRMSIHGSRVVLIKGSHGSAMHRVVSALRDFASQDVSADDWPRAANGDR